MRTADKIALWAGLLMAVAFVAVLMYGHTPP
jgi:hypothetical protein